MTLTRWIAITMFLAAPPARADDETTTATVDESAEPEGKTGYFQIGAGFSSDEIFIARAAIVQPNLFKTGQRLALTADISEHRQNFAIAYAVPDVLGSGLDLSTELFSRSRVYPAFTRDAKGGSLTLGKRVSRTTRVHVRYHVEHVQMELGELTASAKPTRVGAAPLGEGMFASLGAGIEYTTLDTPFLPQRGTRLALFADRADRRLGSDHELVRVGGALEHARPVGPFTLRLQGRASYVHGLDPMGVPLAHRLFHDGHRDVRGYALEQGTLMGDNAEALGRVELELPIWKAAGLSIAGWADAGVRFTTDSAFGGSLLQRSVGFSLIWRSPIGPLRFDFAFPLDGADRNRQFLFNVGGRF
jgi:outer membrane protein insertion porin family